jgi:signal peptidase I
MLCELVGCRVRPGVRHGLLSRRIALRECVSSLKGCSWMSNTGRRLRRDVLGVLLVAATSFVARASFADHYRVPSGSMEPTVAVGDQICVDKRAYGLRLPMSETYVLRAADPARGDVIVLDSPLDGEVLLKRVVAMPGDVVAVQDGRVTIDGDPTASGQIDGGVEELLGRPHSLGTEYGGGPDFGPSRVPEGKYLVLGDDRGNSKDGRYFGWIDRGAVLGRAVAVCMHAGRPVWFKL